MHDNNARWYTNGIIELQLLFSARKNPHAEILWRQDLRKCEQDPSPIAPYYISVCYNEFE